MSLMGARTIQALEGVSRIARDRALAIVRSLSRSCGKDVAVLTRRVSPLQCPDRSSATKDRRALPIEKQKFIKHK